MRMVFSAPRTPGFSTNPRALQVPAEELMMWAGHTPALTNSAAATAWIKALHPPPQNTNKIFPYLFEPFGMRILRPDDSRAAAVLRMCPDDPTTVFPAYFGTQRTRPDGNI